MSRSIAIQMDPIEFIDIEFDSSFVLALEAQARGYSLFHYLPEHLFFREGEILAKARMLEVRRDKNNHFLLGSYEIINLKEIDVVLMRQDPPFDMAYITATYFLEQVCTQTLIVNDPAQVRNSPEKFLVTQFDKLIPPTLITTDKEEILP